MIGTAARAEPIRVATWNVELSRDGPGLLLRDILRGEDPQIAAVTAVIAQMAPDVLLLTDFDHDPGGATLAAFAEALDAAGAPYPHRFALPSNAGLPSGADLDANGRLGEARDAQGYGRFRGDGAMVLLSRLPIRDTEVRDYSGLLWRDAPGAQLPTGADGAPFLDAAAEAVQRLSSTGHWVVPLEGLTLMAFAATAPVFDGPEDRNGLRNGAEISFWSGVIDDVPGPFVLMGKANLDPIDGEGLHDAIVALLRDPRLTDPAPASLGGAGAADPGHRGDPALDTAEWPGAEAGGPGNLRVDYVLPSADLTVRGAGVHWPAGEAETVRAASRHRMVWVDLDLP